MQLQHITNAGPSITAPLGAQEWLSGLNPTDDWYLWEQHPIGARRPFPSDKWELPPFSKPYAQDAILETFKGSFLTNQYSPGPEQPYLDIWQTPGRFMRVGCEDLVSLFRPTGSASQLDLSFGTLGVPSAASLYARLGTLFTKTAIIDRDPFSSGFSIWFLLVDLVELPRLARDLLRVIPRLFSLKHQVRKNATLKEIANDHLAVQFGLLPTLKDLRDFARILTTWASVYSKKNKLLQRCYTIHPPIIRDILDGGVNVASGTAQIPFGEVNLTFEIGAQPVHMYPTMKYYFVCPELSGILNRIKQFVDRLGILDPAAIWDIIPFSFLVDWLLPVGTWIHKNLKPHLFTANLQVCDFCESLGRSLTVTCIAHVRKPLPTGGGGATSQDVVICRGTGLQYARKRQFPRVPKIQRGPTLTVNQGIVSVGRILIGAALVGQRSGRGGKPKSGHYRRRVRAN